MIIDKEDRKKRGKRTGISVVSWKKDDIHWMLDSEDRLDLKKVLRSAD